MLAQTSDDRKLRIMPDDCLYKIGDTELTKTDNGFYIPTDIYGAQTLTIVSNYNSKDYTSYISIYVEELIEESEQGTDN